ncbi:hypothetical protein [Bacillus sp. SG-1]|nr:hypothetical protein [Bacillus sp. SG-1]
MNFLKKLTGKKQGKDSGCCAVEIKEEKSSSCCGTDDQDNCC